MSRVVAYAAALALTPLLHGLAFPRTRLYFLAWIALVPWFVALRLASLRGALALTAVVTFAGTYLVASWLPAAVAVYYRQPWSLGIALFAGAWTLTLAPWFLAFAAAYRVMARGATRTLPLLVGAAWVTTELIRVRLCGNPFGLLGYSQTPVVPLLQIADVTGVYGVSFLIVAVNAALAELCLARLGARRTGPALAGVGVAGGAVVLALGYALVASRLWSAGEHPPTRVAVAQANLDLGSQWRQEFYGRNLEAYMRLTVHALRAPERPALVVWPESALTFFLADEPAYQRALASVLAPTATELVVGGPQIASRNPERFFNSAFLVAPDGHIVARYDKERLLPFAEYFPLASIELLRREFGRVREFSPGGPNAPLPTVAGPAGVVICNEAMFPQIVGQRVREGAGFLVNLSNDSWLGDPKFSDEALDLTRLRAVEQRRWVVRASTSGPSAIIDPAGRLVAEMAPFTVGTIAGSVQSSERLSVYGRVGDAFALVCAAVCAVAVLRGVRARRGGRG